MTRYVFADVPHNRLCGQQSRFCSGPNPISSMASPWALMAIRKIASIPRCKYTFLGGERTKNPDDFLHHSHFFLAPI
jgi:hypothetical protein